MSFLPGMRRGRGGAAPLALQFIGVATSGSDLTTYNFGNFVIPQPGLVIVGVSGQGNAGAVSVSGVTIGEAAASVVVTSSNEQRPSGVAALAVAAGTHEITVTFSSGRNAAGCAVWLLTGYSSSTPFATASLDTDTAAASIDAVLDVPADGIAVFTSMHLNSNAYGWSSAVERADQDAEAGSRYSAADLASAVLLTGHTETASWTGSATRTIAAASWV